MKTLTVAAVVMAATIGIGAAAQAAEKKAAENVPTIEAGGVSFRVGLDTDAPWQYRPAVETGALPAAKASALKGDGSTTAADVPVLEAGGVTYRIGIDTP